MHISVHSSSLSSGDDNGAKLAPTLTRTERSFLQSVITHLPAMCALTLPTYASYNRVNDGMWTGGTFSCWGTDNREATVRLCGAPGHHNFEFKQHDGAANPHLALAAVLGGGLLGIEKGVELAVGDCDKAVVLMSEDERKAVGLENPITLPRTIKEAREVFVADKELNSLFDETFIIKYLSMNKARRFCILAVIRQVVLTLQGLPTNRTWITFWTLRVKKPSYQRSLLTIRV